MSRDVVIINIPSYLTLSAMIKPFEEFGEIVRAGVDERRRKVKSQINLFITFADAIGATRAIQKKHVRIEGSWVEIDRVREVNDNRSRNFSHEENNLDYAKTRKRKINDEKSQTSREDYPRHRHHDKNDENPKRPRITYGKQLSSGKLLG